MDIHCLFELFECLDQKYRSDIHLYNKSDLGVDTISIKEGISIRDQISQYLLDQGFEKGENIGILSYRGSIEWFLVDMAIQQIGLIPVPIHSNYSPSEMTHVINDADIKFCFISSPSLIAKVESLDSPVQYLILNDKAHSKSIYSNVPTTLRQ